MADDDARHISQAKRFRRSLATGPTRPSASPIDGWRSDVHAAASVVRLGAASRQMHYVLRFEVERPYADQFEIHRVGGSGIDELWFRPVSHRASERSATIGFA